MKKGAELAQQIASPCPAGTQSPSSSVALLREVAPDQQKTRHGAKAARKGKGRGPSRHSPYSPDFLAPLAFWRFASLADFPQ